MGKLISAEMIDKMKELKDVLNAVSAENAEDMIKHLTEDEKDCLLRLYVYENKITIKKINEIKEDVQSLRRLMPSKEYLESKSRK